MLRWIVLALVGCCPLTGFAQKEYGFDNRKSSGQPYLAPEETVKRMKPMPGFSVKLFASEPLMTNPIAMAIDEKGRVWIVESFEYPKRTPKGQAPRDRIVILEDTDGDGVADKRTVFAEGKDFPVTPERAAKGLGAFDMASGLEVGHGGCFVGAPPYLWHLKDTDNDGKADKFEIVASGFGSEDTHETLNTFTWGPDGWLYGLHGVFTISKVKQAAGNDPPLDLDAGVWRYHPRTKKFEVFAEGTSNPWGMDYNRQGEWFICACVIPHLYHIVPGGIYQKQGGKPSYNPYAYSALKEISDHTFHKESGWAHAGLLCLDAPHMPKELQSSVIFGSIHGCSLKRNVLKPNGSTYSASRADDFLVSGDKNFRPIQLRWAPDGSILVSDWHDQNPCHQTKPDDWDYARGRIYRIVPPTTIDPSKWRKEGPLWWKVSGRVTSDSAPRESTEFASVDASDFDSAKVWMMRLNSDSFLHMSDNDRKRILERLVNVSDTEQSPRLIRETASTLVKMSKKFSVLSALQSLSRRGMIQNDPVIPQLLWLTTEREMQRGSEPILNWLQTASQPVVVNYLLPRVMRRMAAEGKVEQITQALQFISKLKDAAKVQQALGGLATALEGRQVKDVAAWKETRTTLTATNNADVNRLVLKLSASFYDSAAVAQSLELLKQPGDGSEKLEAIRYLALLKEQQAMPILLSLITSTGSDEVKLAAARGLSSYSQGDVPGRILAGWKDYSPALRAELITTLRSRKPWARELLQALGKKTIARSDLNDNVALAIRQFNDTELNKLLDQHYGTFRDSPAELDALIVKLRKELPTLQGEVTRGKAVFAKHCMQCHKFEGQGHDVGPVLDGAERTREYLLANVVDPNRVVGTPYFTRTIVLKNGKLLTGILVEEDATTLRLKRENAIIEVVVKADIEEQKTSTKSLMPEGLSNNMTVQDLRDLFQYLEVPPKPSTK